MKLYVYNTDSMTLVNELDAVSYNGDGAQLEDGFCYLGDKLEISETPDLSQRLRKMWSDRNPSATERLNLLEELLVGLIYGGELL